MIAIQGWEIVAPAIIEILIIYSSGISVISAYAGNPQIRSSLGFTGKIFPLNLDSRVLKINRPPHLAGLLLAPIKAMDLGLKM